MNPIKLDSNLRAKLNGLNEHLEVQDEAGQVVGHFLPHELYHQLLYSWAREQFSNSEEHEKAMSEPGGYSTPEAIAYIEKVIGSA